MKLLLFPPTRSADLVIDHLRALVRLGVVDPFHLAVWNQRESGEAAWNWKSMTFAPTAHGGVDVELVGTRPDEIFQGVDAAGLAAIVVYPCVDGAPNEIAPGSFASSSRQLVFELYRNRLGSSVSVSIPLVVIPSREGGQQLPSELLHPDFAGRYVAAPSDSVAPGEADRYRADTPAESGTAHAAHAIASACGLWPGASPALEDAGIEGVSMHSSEVRLFRSFSRLVDVGPVRQTLAARALDLTAKWPSPDPSAYTVATEAATVERLIDRAEKSLWSAHKHRIGLTHVDPFSHVKLPSWPEGASALERIRWKLNYCWVEFRKALREGIKELPEKVLTVVEGKLDERARQIFGEQIWKQIGRNTHGEDIDWDGFGIELFEAQSGRRLDDASPRQAWNEIFSVSLALLDGSTIPPTLDALSKYVNGADKKLVVSGPDLVVPSSDASTRPKISWMTDLGSDRACDPRNWPASIELPAATTEESTEGQTADEKPLESTAAPAPAKDSPEQKQQKAELAAYKSWRSQVSSSLLWRIGARIQKDLDAAQFAERSIREEIRRRDEAEAHTANGAEAAEGGSTAAGRLREAARRRYRTVLGLLLAAAGVWASFHFLKGSDRNAALAGCGLVALLAILFGRRAPGPEPGSYIEQARARLKRVKREVFGTLGAVTTMAGLAIAFAGPIGIPIAAVMLVAGFVSSGTAIFKYILDRDENDIARQNAEIDECNRVVAWALKASDAPRLAKRYAEYLDWGDAISALTHQPVNADGLYEPDAYVTLNPAGLPVAMGVAGADFEDHADQVVDGAREFIFSPSWLKGIAEAVQDRVAGDAAERSAQGAVGAGEQVVAKAKFDPFGDTSEEARGERRRYVDALKSGAFRSLDETLGSKLTEFIQTRQIDRLARAVFDMPATTAEFDVAAEAKHDVIGRIASVEVSGEVVCGAVFFDESHALVPRSAVGDSSALTVRCRDGIARSASVVRASDVSDLAQIELAEALPEMQPLSGRDISEGDDFVWTMLPKGRGSNFGRQRLGYISGAEGSASHISGLPTDFPPFKTRTAVYSVTGSFPGCAVMSQAGEMLGIHTQSSETGDSTASYRRSFIPYPQVKAFLEENEGLPDLLPRTATAVSLPHPANGSAVSKAPREFLEEISSDGSAPFLSGAILPEAIAPRPELNEVDSSLTVDWPAQDGANASPTIGDFWAAQAAQGLRLERHVIEFSRPIPAEALVAYKPTVAESVENTPTAPGPDLPWAQPSSDEPV